jgi:soluble lytic murein transglycosylase-like protein
MLDAITRWRDIADAVGAVYNLPTDLLLAVIATESSGCSTAARVERGFWTRYGTQAVVELRHTDSPLVEWIDYPDFLCTSFGLMQVLPVVAFERGMRLRYPTDLCDPATGIEAGCRQLVHCLHAVNPLVTWRTCSPIELRAALSRYNGGADSAYPTRLLDWRDRLRVLASAALAP